MRISFAVAGYMLAALMAAGTVRAAGDPGFQSVGGLDVYLGVVPGAISREHPADHPEAQMHAGQHHEIGDKHVMVALFDSASGQRVTDADVDAFLLGIGSARSEHRLEPMTVNGALTYGAFMQMPGNGAYRIRVEIRHRKTDAPVVATFDYGGSN